MYARARSLLETLVEQPSVAGDDAAITRCLELVADALAPAAASLELLRYGGPPVLLARFGRPGPAQLVFSGHVDVVPAPASWESAFRLTERDGVLAGRGVVDMKGAVAAFVAAIGAVHGAGDLERCSLELALTGDEEVGSAEGAIPLAASGALSGRSAVCGEPTGFRVLLGSRGLVALRISVRGRGGHAGLAHVLANPTACAARLTTALGALPLTVRDPRFAPPTASLTVTRSAPADGLTAANVVPDAVTLLLDRRLLPGERPEAAIEQIRECVDALVVPPFDAEIDILRRWPAYAISSSEPIVERSARSLAAIGVRAEYGCDLAANDSAWLVEAGIPTVLLGPGDPDQAHTTGECLPSEHLATACAVYRELVRDTAAPS